jgi:hypothetical protein
MSYEEIRIPQELSESVQRAVGMTPRQHGTLGELVNDVAAQQGVRRPENLISEQPTTGASNETRAPSHNL